MLRPAPFSGGSGDWPFALLLAGLAVALACPARRERTPADLVLLGGRVVTLDPGRPEATAVAVRAGLVAAVGGDDEIAALAGPATRRIDLAGALVLPGLVDAHGHIRSLGERLASLDLKGVSSVEEVATRVAVRAAELPPGDWVTGGGWDQNLWPGKAFPDHRPLSRAAPDRPVWLTRVDGHAGWANRRAMEVAGVTRATPDPPGGAIERDARGGPTGVFVDNATGLIEKALPAPTRGRIKASILRALERAAAVGLTGVHDAGVTEEEVAAFRELADAGALPVRVYLMWSGMDGGPLERRLADPPLVNHRDRLTLRAVKLMVDGAMGSRGALFLEDYLDDPGNRGLFVMPEAAIEAAAATALRRGYQVCTHAIGDRGIRLVLDAYERALRAAPSPDARPRIEHLQCVHPDDVPRLKRLGVIASMQPSHATSDMYWAEDRIGPERGRGLYAWRWVLDAGVPLAAGSDFPVDPESPLVGLQSAVTRRDLKGWPEGGWHPDQRMTFEEALRAYTEGAAYAAFEEKVKGRIAPGFWADLTVVDRDLRAVPPAEITSATVLYTVVGGSIVHAAADRAAAGPRSVPGR